MGGLHPSCFPLILLVKQQDLLVINLYIVAWGGGGGVYLKAILQYASSLLERCLERNLV